MKLYQVEVTVALHVVAKDDAGAIEVAKRALRGRVVGEVDAANASARVMVADDARSIEAADLLALPWGPSWTNEGQEMTVGEILESLEVKP